MKKRTSNLIMSLYADCLRKLYDTASLRIPDEFDPEKESSRIASTLVAKGLGIKLT